MSYAVTAIGRRAPGVHGRASTFENNFVRGDAMWHSVFLHTGQRILGTARDAGHFGDADSPLTEGLVTAVTNANPAVVTSTAHGLSNGNVVRFKNVEGMTQLNGNTFTLANVTANTFELSGTDSTAFGVYTQRGVWTLQTATATLLRPGLLMAYDRVNKGWTHWQSGGSNGVETIRGALYREAVVSNSSGGNQERYSADIMTGGFWKANRLIVPGNSNLGINGDALEATIRTQVKALATHTLDDQFQEA